MKYPLLSKTVALFFVITALLLALEAVGNLVHERRARQLEAENGVADSLAGQQTVLGPALVQQCEEVWTHTEGTGKEQKTVTDRRELAHWSWPEQLTVAASVTTEPLYRGLFKLNGYVAHSKVEATWPALKEPVPAADRPGARVVCQSPMIAVALSDARGVRSAKVSVSGTELAVLPGSTLRVAQRGLHAMLPAGVQSSAFTSTIELDLAGTRSVSWVPVGEQTQVKLASNWMHPSFGGRFLPSSRSVTPAGFTSQWDVSALATTARQTAPNDVTLCDLRAEDSPLLPDAANRACIESFGVTFIDPVNGYVLNDRALKYGLLFVALTFVGVALVELTRRLRVHPIQYLLVGFALTVFFLLLLSLSEHVRFGLAYLAASGACTALLTYYGAHVLRGFKPGLAFGTGIAALYGALYALLQLEQAALVLGSTLLFVVLAAVMIATRRMDWYALAAQLRNETGVPAKAAAVQPPSPAAGTVPA